MMTVFFRGSDPPQAPISPLKPLIAKKREFAGGQRGNVNREADLAGGPAP